MYGFQLLQVHVDQLIWQEMFGDFAVKFYTEEGNFDLVGNNMPVFFIQDAIKFPDLDSCGKTRTA